MQIHVNTVTITSSIGDMTAWEGDVIVNASNSGLYGGGGVDGAIHRVGGPQIAEECSLIRKKLGGCLPGEAAITTAGNLPAQYVIHTVGPIWKGGGGSETALLASCYRSTLDLAVAHGARSIAFPNISTGIYNFPKSLACTTALDTVIQYVKEQESRSLSLEKIEFICYELENAKLYEEALQSYDSSS